MFNDPRAATAHAAMGYYEGKEFPSHQTVGKVLEYLAGQLAEAEVAQVVIDALFGKIPIDQVPEEKSPVDRAMGEATERWNVAVLEALRTARLLRDLSKFVHRYDEPTLELMRRGVTMWHEAGFQFLL